MQKTFQILTYDILDVTEIESQGLNLNDLITNTMDDIITNRGFANNKIQRNNVIKLLYQPQDIFVEIDKAIIARHFRSVNNAIKFAEEKGGTGSIITENTDNSQDVM